MSGKLVLVVMVGMLACGCATSFTGSAHIEGGRQACEAKCKGQGMEIAGMVYMGEYSSACVCEVPGKAAGNRREQILAAGASGAAAGVIMQERRNQQNAMILSSHH